MLSISSRSILIDLIKNCKVSICFICCFLFSVKVFGQAPVINSFNPISAKAGEEIVIKGNYFDAVSENNTVYFGGVKAKVKEASSHSLVVTVPLHASTELISVHNLTTKLSCFSANRFLPKHNLTIKNSMPQLSETKIPITTGLGLRTFTLGDLNGDDFAEIIYVNSTANSISILPNSKSKFGVSKSFVERIELATAENPFDIKVFDIDADGKLDIIVSNSAANLISVYRNTSSLSSVTFENPLTFATGKSPEIIKISDIDSDGKPDIIVTNKNGGSVSILKNISNGTIAFANKVDVPTGGSPKSLCVADVNGDKFPELIVVNEGGRNALIFQNESSPGIINSYSFPRNVSYGTSQETTNAIVYDLDEDGKPELITIGNYWTKLSVFKNVSNSNQISTTTFAEPVDFITDSGMDKIDIFDVNSDGKADVVMHSGQHNYGSSVFINSFVPGTVNSSSFKSRNYMPLDFATTFQICDLDGDGSVEWISNNLNKNEIIFSQAKVSYLKPSITSFTPASAPIGSVITITGKNFNVNAQNNLVQFGFFRAEVIDASETQLRVRVPLGANTNYITVTDAISFLQGSSPIHFVPSHQNVSNITAASFYPRGEINLPAKLDPVVADIDGDGKPDIVLINYSESSFSVVTGKTEKGDLQANSFTNNYPFFGTSYVNKIKLADVNGDGKVDVVLCYSNGAHIFINISTPGRVAFINGTAYINNDDPVEQVLDVNNDGKVDLAIIDGEDVKFAFNDFVPKIETKFNIPPGAPFRFPDYNTDFFETADIDGDGKSDILAYGPWQNYITLSRNITDLNATTALFDEKIKIEIGRGASKVKLVDLDGDGKLDIVISSSFDNTISILRNTSNSNKISFENMFSLPAVAPRSIALEDINGDGKIDICFINGDNLVSIYQNNAQVGNLTVNSFGARIDITVGSTLQGISLSDLDGDGRPDILLNDGRNPTILLQNLPVKAGFTITTSADKAVYVAVSNEPRQPLIIDSQLTVNGNFAAEVSQAKIFFSKDYVPKEDSLFVTVDIPKMGNMSTKFDQRTGSLQIVAPAGTTQANWQEALKAVKYANNNTKSPTLTQRTITYELYNDSFRSDKAEKNIVIDYTEKSNADLQYIGQNFGRLYPTFHKDSTSYKVYVGNDVSLITLSAKSIDASSIVKMNGTKVDSKWQIDPISLAVGNNQVTIAVLAQDGITQKTYDVIIYRSSKTNEIVFKPFAEVTYGNKDIELNAYSTNYNSVLSYTSSNTNVATVFNNKVKIIGAGVTTITVSSPNLPNIDPVSHVLVVKKALLTVKADDKSRIYLGEDPVFTVSYSGFLNYDDQYYSTQKLQFTTTATKSSYVGEYFINVTGVNTDKYEVKYVPGRLKVVTDVDITPELSPLYFTLSAGGNKYLELEDVAKIKNYSTNGPNVSISPNLLNCSTLGKQVVKITSTNANPINSGVTFNSPSGVAVDKQGNIFVSDFGNHLIRKISTSGLVTTFAGTGISGLLDGPARYARFTNPRGLAFDKEGNLYVGDGGAASENGCIRKITPSGEVTTVFKGENPNSLAVDKAGNIYFVGSRNLDRSSYVFKLSPTRVLSVLNSFYDHYATPTTVSLDENEHYLYVSCSGDKTVRRLDLYGFPQSLSGDNSNGQPRNYGSFGKQVYSVLAGPAGKVYVGLSNSQLFMLPYDTSLNLIGQSSALIMHPTAMALDKNGDIIIADVTQHTIFKVTPEGNITIVAGNGRQGANNGDLSLGNNGQVFSVEIPVIVKSKPQIISPLNNVDIPLNSAGKGEMPDFIKDIVVKNICAGVKTTVVQSVAPGTLIEPFKVTSVVITATDEYGGEDAKIFNVTAKGLPFSINSKANLKFNLDPVTKQVTLKFDDLATVNNPLSLPYSVEITPSVFKCENSGKQNVTALVRGGVVGKAKSASFGKPLGIVKDRAGNFYITDTEFHKIKKITTTGDVITLAGSGVKGYENGAGTAASFNDPRGIAVDAGGDLYVADYQNNRIRKIDAQGVTTVFAGDGTGANLDQYSDHARIDNPVSLAVDQYGNVYFTSVSCTLRKISKEGMVTTLVESSFCEVRDGKGENARIYGSSFITCDKEGNVYMADGTSGYIRKVTPQGWVTTLPMTTRVYNMRGITLDDKGDIYVIQTNGSYTGSSILKFNTNGVLLKTIYVTDSRKDKLVYTNFGGLVFDNDGNLIVTDLFNGAIHKITMDDGILTTLVERDFSDDIDGNIGNINSDSLSVQIPIDILSVPIFKGTYPDLNAQSDGNGNIILPDYTTQANAVDLCTGLPLPVSQTPAAGSTVAPGTAITFTATNASNNTANVSFKVYSVPVPVIKADGSTTFNFGNSVLLKADPEKGYSYQWKRNGVDITGATLAYYTAKEKGDYTVSISVNTIIQTSLATHVEVILPAPTVSSFFPTAVAADGAVEIRGSHFDEATSVKFGGVEAKSFSIRSSSLIVAIVGSGASGNVEVSTPMGKHTLSGFTFVPVPTITPEGVSEFIVGTSIKLTANPSSGFTYQWSKDGYQIPNANSSTLEISEKGVYQVSILKNDVFRISQQKTVKYLPLPLNNFNVAASDVVCIGQNNGTISIVGSISTDYIAIVSSESPYLNKSYGFKKSLLITDLPPGTYEMCIVPSLMVENHQCYTLKIAEPKRLYAYMASVKDNMGILELEGADRYHITVNGTLFTTTSTTFKFPLSNGTNQISVATDKPCQGTIEKQVNLASQPLVYPNPFQKVLTINTGVGKANVVEVKVFSLDGKMVYVQNHSNVTEFVKADLSHLPTGTYLLKLSVDGTESVFKILKK